MSAGSYALKQGLNGEKVTSSGLRDAAVSGAVSGAVSSNLPDTGSALADGVYKGAASGTASYVATSSFHGGPTWKGVGNAAKNGAIGGGIGYGVGTAVGTIKEQAQKSEGPDLVLAFSEDVVAQVFDASKLPQGALFDGNHLSTAYAERFQAALGDCGGKGRQMDVSKVTFAQADLSHLGDDVMAIHVGGTGGKAGKILVNSHGDKFANLSNADKVVVVAHELVHEAQSKFYGSQAAMDRRILRDNAWWPNEEKRYAVTGALERTYYKDSYWTDPRFSLESIAESVSHEALGDYFGIDSRFARR
ncbi:MAG: hypothetical protein SFV15_13185 [Polyangiaceae bacterium]|nr:hypothetical protein [Polyangiaceae bacterium]